MTKAAQNHGMVDMMSNETSANAKQRILVVDDVADNREVLTRRLVRRDFDVEEAAGGIEALEMIEKNSYDIILLDIMMPDMNGADVLTEIRKTYSINELPVIMVSAKSQSEDVVDCLENGANDYVTKPVDFAVALARINSQLEAKQITDDQKRSQDALKSEAIKLSNEAEQRRLKLEENEKALLKETKLRERSEKELQFLAYHDSLTGLLNRVAFDDAIQEMWEKCRLLENQSPALLFIDLDAFKSVNDQHGHKIGDLLLKAVAERICDLAGAEASIARLGGDEFAIAMIAEDDSTKPMELAERLVATLSTAFEIEGVNCEIGASCGVAQSVRGDEDISILMKAADLAMYHGKDAGRGRVVRFEHAMLEKENQRKELENDLKLAVQKSQFKLFFQPLVDTKTRQIVCFEALLRWNHPTRGMVSPEVFIPMAEDMGLISTIGNWVLRQACEQASKWDDRVKVAVNVSALQFRGPELIQSIVNTLGTTQLSPSRLELEITETVLMERKDYSLKNLKAIRELGVCLALDDFGTGYSSLAYLRQYDFDTIKIDKSFINQIGKEQGEESIVQAILNLSTGMGIGTTAEGVETEEQLEYVTEIGCNNAQGYLLSKPLDADDALELLNGWSKSENQIAC